MTCVSEPISWLRLEQHALTPDADVDAHLASCDACRSCRDEIASDLVLVPEPRYVARVGARSPQRLEHDGEPVSIANGTKQHRRPSLVQTIQDRVSRQNQHCLQPVRTTVSVDAAATVPRAVRSGMGGRPRAFAAHGERFRAPRSPDCS